MTLFLLKALAWWCLFLAAAVAMGALREGLLTPRLGERRAQQVGTLACCAVLFALIALSVRALSPTASGAWALGLMWTAMVMAFEFLFFHYVGKRPWRELLENYNVRAGRLWVLVLLTTAAGPALARALWPGQ